MRVRMRILGDSALFRSVLGQRELELELPAGATLDTLERAIGLELSALGTFAVNGEAVDRTHRLEDGDLVELIAMMAGG